MTCTLNRCHYSEFVHLARKHVFWAFTEYILLNRVAHGGCSVQLPSPHSSERIPRVRHCLSEWRHRGIERPAPRLGSFVTPSTLDLTACPLHVHSHTHTDRERLRTLFYLTAASNPFHLARLTFSENPVLTACSRKCMDLDSLRAGIAASAALPYLRRNGCSRMVTRVVGCCNVLTYVCLCVYMCIYVTRNC
jgi:hypothetical protein